MEPDGFGGIHQASFAVKACIDAAVHFVPAMFEPEGEDVAGQIGYIAFAAVEQIFLKFVFLHFIIYFGCYERMFNVGQSYLQSSKKTTFFSLIVPQSGKNM